MEQTKNAPKQLKTFVFSSVSTSGREREQLLQYPTVCPWRGKSPRNSVMEQWPLTLCEYNQVDTWTHFIWLKLFNMYYK